MQRIESGEWTIAETPVAQGQKSTPTAKRKPVGRSAAAAAGIFSGIASLFIGLVCVAVHVVAPNDKVFDRVGSALLICAIPLMLAGSLVMDEAPRRRDD